MRRLALGGLSRRAIFAQVDAALCRLDTHYVDLLQIHLFDPEVPVEETMQALHDVVQAGKARYLARSRSLEVYTLREPTYF